MRSFIRASRAIRPAAGLTSRTAIPNVARPMAGSLMQNNFQTVRFYGAGPPPLTREFVQERIIDTLGCFDKIEDPSKITPEANFMSDLKMDSLDVVEALFFIEEEFGIEMPDHEADEIKTVGQAVDYILAQPDAF